MAMPEQVLPREWECCVHTDTAGMLSQPQPTLDGPSSTRRSWLAQSSGSQCLGFNLTWSLRRSFLKVRSIRAHAAFRGTGEGELEAAAPFPGPGMLSRDLLPAGGRTTDWFFPPNSFVCQILSAQPPQSPALLRDAAYLAFIL